MVYWQNRYLLEKIFLRAGVSSESIRNELVSFCLSWMRFSDPLNSDGPHFGILSVEFNFPYVSILMDLF